MIFPYIATHMQASGLYRAQVMHHRLAPKRHRFSYTIFMFWLDLDEMQQVARKLTLFGLRKPAVFRYSDTDHIKYPRGDVRNAQDTRTKLNEWLQSNGVASPAKVFLLTHVRMFGYVFNPVSFYFCYDAQQELQFVVTEISNTFGEMKMFLIDKKADGAFKQEETKYFYVSPFTDMQDRFVFHYDAPGEKLHVRIDTVAHGGERYFISTLTGVYRTISDARLFYYVLRFPFVTLRVITAIHWQALLLWLKKLRWHKKSDDPELQRDIMNDRISLPE